VKDTVELYLKGKHPPSQKKSRPPISWGEKSAPTKKTRNILHHSDLDEGDADSWEGGFLCVGSRSLHILSGGDNSSPQ